VDLPALPSHATSQDDQKEHLKPDDEDDAATWASSMADSLSPDHAPFLSNGAKAVSSPSTTTASTTGLSIKEKAQRSGGATAANAQRVLLSSSSMKSQLHRTVRSENIGDVADVEGGEQKSSGKQSLGIWQDRNADHHRQQKSEDNDDDGSWLIEGESAADEDDDRHAAAANLLGQQLHNARMPSTIAEESTHCEGDDTEDELAMRTSATDEHNRETSNVCPINFPRKTASMGDLHVTARSEPTSIFLSPLHSPQSAAGATPTPVTTSSDSGGVNPTQISLLSQQQLQLPNDLSSDKPARVILPMKPLKRPDASQNSSTNFEPYYGITNFLQGISTQFFRPHYTEPLAAATWIGFWALLHVTCANYVLTPMRDAIALAVGVRYMPKLTLASTLLALCSSVPIGWLFEAPDPNRRRLWKRMGLTRGETQGTSLALFYRFFALILLSYAVGFPLIEWLISHPENVAVEEMVEGMLVGVEQQQQQQNIFEDRESAGFGAFVLSAVAWIRWNIPGASTLLSMIGQSLYIAFFLVVHLMKLHSLSLVWGVTSEAMEYEDVARQKVASVPNTADIMVDSAESASAAKTLTRYQRLALIGFGGTLGGILGSMLASSLAQILYLPGLLVLAAVLLEVSAQLSIELGRIMQKHWEEQQLFQSTNDLGSLVDTSMRRSVSLGSMKRIGSGNSLNRLRSSSESKNGGASPFPSPATSPRGSESSSTMTEESVAKEDTFVQRLLRGIKTIFSSRLLMAIFTYNALYASTTVLLSFQRAALVANRNETTSKEADMAFLANINMASSVAIFALQASGAGAFVAQSCGQQGTLSLMPLIRLAGVLALAWWHHTSDGQPPNLMAFLLVDECCKIMNLAVAKPVRESLWRGLSNEARYEAKPIVDTLANRWGGGSAAFLVSTLNKTLDLFGVPAAADGSRMVFGYPPILFLCIIIAAWWSVVSADLGQIRKRIDVELKKRQ